MAGDSRASTCNKIFDFLYIGGFQKAEDNSWLCETGITCVINARKQAIAEKISNLEYVDVPVDDDEFEPIQWYFDDISEKIEKHRRSNGKILVNCEMGISRSATLCLVYMVRFMNYTLRSAYFYVKNARPCIRPNVAFWREMIQYEIYHRRRPSVRLLSTVWSKSIPDVYCSR